MQSRLSFKTSGGAISKRLETKKACSHSIDGARFQAYTMNKLGYSYHPARCIVGTLETAINNHQMTYEHAVDCFNAHVTLVQSELVEADLDTPYGA
jgi:hypothetical protein